MNQNEELSGFSAVIGKGVFDLLLTRYLQELNLLTPAQELSLTHLLLEEDSDEVEIEADVYEDTLQ